MLICPDRAEVYPVQFRLLRQGRPGHRRRRGTAEPDPLHPSGGQQGGSSGICGSIPRCWPCPSGSDIRRPDRDNTIDVYISDEYVWMCWPTAHGSSSSPPGRNPLTREEKRAWLDTLTGVSPWAPTPSSPSETTLSGPISSGVTYIAEPGGSIRDDHVIDNLQ